MKNTLDTIITLFVMLAIMAVNDNNEIYVNEWQSMQSVRKYRILPKKYQTILNENY